MKQWITEKGEANIYEAIGRNKLNTLVSPGHYFSFSSIITNGVLAALIKRGVQHLVVSSNDNLMSTVDPAILAFHIGQNNNVTSEVVPKLFDRGGAPVMINGEIRIFEDFRFPDLQSLWKIPYFNPITTWIKIEALLNLFGLDEVDLIKASENDTVSLKKCQQAVYNLANRLPTYPVLKHLNEDMGNGFCYTFPVIQFEKLFGDLISGMTPFFLLVPKLMRHTQIKSVEHIYQVYNDQSLDVLRSQISLQTEVGQKIKEGTLCG
jgi:hypothetical protein